MEKIILCETLGAFGPLSIKHKHIKVLTDDALDSERIAKLQVIFAVLAKYPNTSILYDNPGFARLGYIKSGEFCICVKPIKAQGKKSPGIKNEIILQNEIATCIDECGEINLIFDSDRSPHHDFVCLGVRGVKTNYGAGNLKSKPDIVLDTIHGKINLSIKQRNAEKWHSVDSTHHIIARDAIKTAINNNTLILSHNLGPDGSPTYIKGDHTKPVMKMSSEMMIPLSDIEKNKVVFGESIHAVIIQTFKSKHFVRTKNTLIVQCNSIYTDINKIEFRDEPVLLIRNDPSRNCVGLGIAGIRIEAVMRSRIHKNAIKLI